MKKFRTINVEFQIKGMHGVFNNTVDVMDGSSLEKAVQKKYATKRKIEILKWQITHIGEIA